jgi:hypothetical protein
MGAEERPDQQQEPEENPRPDEEGTGVEPVEGDQGETIEQEPGQTQGQGFDPDRPVRTSPPEASQQSGVPALEGGGNEGVEPQPQYAGTVEPQAQEEDGEEQEQQEQEQPA